MEHSPHWSAIFNCHKHEESDLPLTISSLELRKKRQQDKISQCNVAGKQKKCQPDDGQCEGSMQRRSRKPCRGRRWERRIGNTHFHSSDRFPHSRGGLLSVCSTMHCCLGVLLLLVLPQASQFLPSFGSEDDHFNDIDV